MVVVVGLDVEAGDELGLEVGSGSAGLVVVGVASVVEVVCAVSVGGEVVGDVVEEQAERTRVTTISRIARMRDILISHPTSVSDCSPPQ